MEGKWESNIGDADGGVVFFRNTIVRTLIAFSVLPILVSIGLLAYFIRPSDALLVLHYNVYFGVDVLGAWWQAYFLPLMSLGFLLGHTLFAWHFYSRSERIAAYILLLSSGFLSIGALIASLGIMIVNY